MPQYWLAGTNPTLEHPMSDVWVARGIWILDYDGKPRFKRWTAEIRPGDRLALRDKHSQTTMIVRYLGIVRDLLYRAEERAVFAVDWLPTRLDRVIPFKGIPGHGAGIQRLTRLTANNPRTREVFFI